MTEVTRGGERAFSRLPRERRVADILGAARAVFAEKGYDDASVAEIATRAGVVEGSVYRYFEHKRALLVKVVEDWYEGMLSDFDEHLVMIQGTWNRLRFMIWKHLSVIEKDPAMCRLVFGVLRPGADYRTTTVFDLNRRYTRRTMDILREGIANGEIRSDIPLGFARDMIYGGVEHHTWAFLRGEGGVSVDAASDALTAIIRGGLGTSSHLRREMPAVQPNASISSIAPYADRLAQTLARLERVADQLEVPRSVSSMTDDTKRVPTRSPRAKSSATSTSTSTSTSTLSRKTDHVPQSPRRQPR